MTKADYTTEQLEQIKAALETAKETQAAFWDALHDLEMALGNHELSLDNNDLENYEVDDILGLIESDDEEEEKED